MTRWKRLAPVLGLFVLSPLIAEYLLGNIAIDALLLGFYFLTLYGGGAVFVREVARRSGRGWPTIIVLALVYGLIEEGFVTQSLFAPTYFGFNLTGEAFIPGLGIGGWWTIYVLSLHTVWSICVPIAIVEAFVPDRARTPWLGNVGLAVTLILFLGGATLNAVTTYEQEHFIASPLQFAGLTVVILGLLVAAFARWPFRTRVAGAAPAPWVVGACSLVAWSVFIILDWVVEGWPIVIAYLACYAAIIMALVFWSRRSDWSSLHILAFAGGALLTYAWQGYPHEPIIGSKGFIDLVGNTVFAIGAIAVLAAAVLKLRRATVAPH